MGKKEKKKKDWQQALSTETTHCSTSPYLFYARMISYPPVHKKKKKKNR